MFFIPVFQNKIIQINIYISHMKQKMTIKGLFKKSILLFGILLFTITACRHNDSAPNYGDWTKIDAGFRGTARNSATSFQIGDSVYVGFGLDPSAQLLKDFYVYTISGGYWKVLGELQGNTHADSVAAMTGVFPGPARFGAVGFSVGGKGYVGLGFSNVYQNDFYQFNPVSKSWKKLANFPGTPRRYAVSFVINDIAYVGTGYGGFSTNANYLPDFWSYDYKTDKWAQVRDFAGSKREGAVSLVINGKAYVGFGNNNGVTQQQKNIYEFDPGQNTWTEKTTLRKTDGITARSFAVAFSIGNSGFVGLGLNGGVLTDMWEFEPVKDVWTQRTSISDKCGVGRGYSVSFSDLKNIGYVTTGLGGSRLDDFWSFNPTNTKTDCPK